MITGYNAYIVIIAYSVRKD